MVNIRLLKCHRRKFPVRNKLLLKQNDSKANYYYSFLEKLKKSHTISYPEDRSLSWFYVDEQLSLLFTANKRYHSGKRWVYYFVKPLFLIKNFSLEKKIIWYYLIFLDKRGLPIYRISASQAWGTKRIPIPDTFHTKYNLEFIGYLNTGGNPKPYLHKKRNKGSFVKGGEKKLHENTVHKRL